MKTVSFPGHWSDALPSGRSLLKWRQSIAEKRAVMSRFAGWIAIVAVVTLLIWQTAATEYLWPRVICCVLLAIFCTLFGIRLGTNSTAAYMKDVHRLNKVLADQNEQLQDANTTLLRASKKMSD
jgi:hypothetical protein